MNFGSTLPLEVHSLTSPQDYLVPNNNPRKAVSANHKSKLHIKGFLEVGDLSGWKGAGLRNSNPNKHNQITTYHMPIIHPNSKSLLELTKNLPNFNNISERLISSGKKYYSNYSGSNESINQFHSKDHKSNNVSTKSNNRDGSANKSKVPDIQMINKYYGLIPKKFTVHSRQSDCSQRDSKHTTGSHTSRSKSAHPSRKKLGHLGPSKSLDFSDDETNEPQLKVSLRLRRGNSLDLTKSLAEETEGGSKNLMAIGKQHTNGSNIGLVAKKISVEKPKKWKKSGLLRSSSLSSMDEDRNNSHASKMSTGDDSTESNTETQRVIKIDLNNMSWEESFQSCYSPFEELQSTRESSPVPEKLYATLIKGSVNDSCPILSSGSDGSFGGGGWTTSVNTFESGSNSSGGGGCGSPSSSLSLPSDSLDTFTVHNNREADTHACIDYNEEDLKEKESVLNDGESYCHTPPTTLPILSVRTPDDNTLRTTIEASANRPTSSVGNGDEFNEGEIRLKMPVGGESPSRMDCGKDNSSVPSCAESRRARMRKTISFDEQILRNKEPTSGQNYSAAKQDAESSKIRRPTTASCASRLAPSIPPKAVPWTQKTGKNLSLSERRSKFQKSVSIHSTAESLDYGEGEGSDCDTDFSMKASSPPAAFTPSPTSSVYRDTFRKPLFFIPAPEVSTMISQISPIDNLEIQCEIEKVAIMLKNMQNQNKSFIDLTPAAAFISQNTHLTANTRTSCSSNNPLSKENDLSLASNMVKDTQDINGNPTDMNANSNHLDGNNVTLHISNTNGSGFPNPSTTSSNISLKDKSPIPMNACPASDPAPHETTEQPMGKANTAIIDNLSTGSHQTKTSRVVTSNPSECYSPGHNVSPDEMRKETGPTGNLHSSSNLKIKENYGTYGSSNTLTSTQITKRPPLRKSASISCEQELYKTPGDHENEANGNGNSSKIENKSARPKTAVTLSSTNKTSKTPCGKTNVPSIITSHSQRARSLNSQVSTTNRSQSPTIRSTSRTGVKPNTKENDKNENVIISECGSNNGSNKNQAQKNRKILIKKALIEINQSSSHFQKKWGILGRPKTAPTSNNNPHGVEKLKKSGVITGSGGSGSGSTTSHKRQPLKASQPLNGVKSGQVVGKQVILKNPGQEEGESSESDGKEEGTMNKDATGSENDHNPSRRSLHRQSFSLDEGLLLGFSNKEFGWKTQNHDEEPVPSKTETLFQNSKKREECLKIYDKMMKTGLSVKLDTILRGMMTPSEYRVFIKAAENAAREAAIAKEEAEAALANETNAELLENVPDAGVSESINVNNHEAVQA